MSKQTDITLAQEYFDEAMRQLKSRKYEEAKLSFEQAILIYEKRKMWEQWVEANNEIGDIYIDLIKYDKGIEHLTQVLEKGQEYLGEEHPQVANSWYSLGYHYNMKGNYKQAIAHIQKALSIFKKKLGKEHSYVAKSLRRIAICYDGLGEHEVAIGFLQNALEICLKKPEDNPIRIVLNLNSTGLCIYNTGDYKSAIDYYQRALLALKNMEDKPTLRADILNNIGICFFQKGDMNQALVYQQEALTIRKKKLGEEHPNIALSLNNIGICYTNNGDYDRAIQHHLEALMIRKKSLGEEHLDVAMSLNNLGNSYYSKSDYELAIGYYEAALGIWTNQLEKTHTIRAHGLNNLGACYALKESYSLAIPYFQEAIAIRRESLGDNHPSLGECLNGLAGSYAGENNYSIAIPIYEEALSILKRNFGNKHPLISECCYNLGDCYSSTAKYDLAVQHYQKAIIAVSLSFDQQAPFYNPDLGGYSDGYRFLRALYKKVNAFYSLATQLNSNFKYLQAALSTIVLATQLVSDIRRSYKAEGSKHALAEEAAKVYNRAIDIALKTSKIYEQFTPIPQHPEFTNIPYSIVGAKNLAFDFTEQSKAVLLLSNLKDNEAKASSNIPIALLEKEQQLKIELNYLENSINTQKNKGDEKDEALLTKFQSQYFEQKQEYDALIEQFEVDYPDYYQLKYSISTASVQDLQSYLKQTNTAIQQSQGFGTSSNNSTIILSYHIAEEKIYSFVISSNDYQITTVEKPSNFSQLIEKLQEDIQLGYVKEFIQSATKLFDVLLRPVWSSPEVSGQALQSISKLIIIPHGELYYVPFDVLLNQHQITDVKNFTNLPYLIRDFDISYHYSATLLLHSHQRQQQTSTQTDSFFGLAPIQFGEDAIHAPKEGYVVKSGGKQNGQKRRILKSSGNEAAALVDLEETELEVKEVYQLFEEQGKDAIALFYDQANKQNLKEHIGDYKYVLISTHGFLQETGRNTLSGIHLAPVRGQQLGDRSEETGSSIVEKGKRKMKEGAIQQLNNSTIESDDFLLHTSETYHLNLNADLVVLSSCESGVGELKVGEGMMALNRGFLYAGAGNIIYSLFKVPQDSTSQLTQALFRYILEGEKSYASALRKAKLELIEDEMMEPMDWAGFALVGG